MEKDALDANGFKIPTEIVLELYASPSCQQKKNDVNFENFQV